MVAARSAQVGSRSGVLDEVEDTGVSGNLSIDGRRARRREYAARPVYLRFEDWLDARYDDPAVRIQVPDGSQGNRDAHLVIAFGSEWIGRPRSAGQFGSGEASSTCSITM